MLTVQLAGLPVHTRSLPANKRREFMTSQSDIQWVDLCVFVYVTILCLSLATLSICEPPSIKHVSAPRLESREEFSCTHFPAYSKSHRLCTLNLPPRCLCVFGWLCICVVFVFVSFSLWKSSCLGGGHYVIGRFLHDVLLSSPHDKDSWCVHEGIPALWIKLTRKFTQKENSYESCMTLFCPWNTEIWKKNVLIIFLAMIVFQAWRAINVVHMIHAQFQAEI